MQPAKVSRAHDNQNANPKASQIETLDYRYVSDEAHRNKNVANQIDNDSWAQGWSSNVGRQ
jgi:hypothetical protein